MSGVLGIDASHAGYLVAHPLGLKDVTDTEVIEPGLMTMTQPVGAQAGPQRKPTRERGPVARLFA